MFRAFTAQVRPWFVLLPLLAILICVGTTGAQITTGTILGTVSDPSGAVIPGAKVTATNADTGFARAVTTDGTGNYMLPSMPLGRYQLKAEAEGFKAAVSNFTLIVDQKLRADLTLTIGSKTEVVEVRGVGETLLQTDQPDINQIVQEKEIRALPLNGRDFFSLLLLTAGVQDTSNDQGGATTNVTFSVNGMRPESNSVTLDGIEMSSIRESDVDLRPSLDAISEFKVLTSVFSAEYGHTAGGVISIQSKGGTNQLRGSAWEFLRNDKFNAANFFRNPVNPNKAPLKQNTFGASLGGPIRKDKTFFFADYQGYRVRKVNEAFARVPEAAFRAGDFSSLLPDTLIWDPATGGKTQFRDPSRATPANPEGLNIIPVNRFHPFGKALLDAVGLPNLPQDYPLGNYFIRQPDRVGGNEAGVRFDHVLSEKDNIFVRFRGNDSLLNTADPLARPDGPMPGIGLEVGDDSRGIVQGGTHRDRNRNLVVSHVHIFSPGLINEFRTGMHRYLLDVVQHAYGMNLAEKFGLKGVNTGKEFSGLPIIYLNAYNSIGGDDWKPLFFRETSLQFNDNVTRTMGRLTMKAGGEYRRRYENNYFAIFPAGAFYMYGENTSKEFSYVGGHELADLLMGYPMMGWRGRRFGDTDLRDNQYGFYVQNDWKASDRLTLNFGVRYEYASPFFQPSNQMGMFDFATQKLLIAGQEGVSRYILYPDKNNWAPRIGLAFKVQPKTTIRAGFGIFYNPENAKKDDIRYNPPFYRQYTNFETWNFWNLPPDFVDPGNYPTGYELYVTDRTVRTGYGEQYSFAIQRELPFSMLFEAAYVGSQGHKLPYRYNMNQPTPRGDPVPYPDLGEINFVDDIGNMVYHSAQFKLERRFATGFYFLTTYTWSKCIDNLSSVNFETSTNGGVQNIFDPKQNRAVADWDVPHRFAFSWVYDLPFGKGRRFTSTNPVANALLGDWQATGIFVASSGVPGTVYVGSTIPGGEARPNVLRNPNLPSSQRTPDRWFDETAFEINRNASGGVIAGNAGRNIVRGAPYGNVDLGLSKGWPISERFRLQLRAEVFNLTNSPHFALPQRRMSDAAFSRITHTRNPVNYGSTATSYANRMLQFAIRLEF